MRYLKATAQDLCGNGHADTVILHFYQQQPDGPDELIHETVGLDMTVDGKVDVQLAGERRSGAPELDKHLLASFADSFLKLNWFNPARQWQRTLIMYVDHFGKQGLPNAIKLDFHEPAAPGGNTPLIYKVAAYDGDSDGVLESFTNSDVDRNGVADTADKELVRSLCTTFLALSWHEV
ncbi:MULTISPECIES: hypothetical protein [Pseudomonas]|uniref:Uncharacterized protein n=1 Tax=Pseudomonas azadiae TaxID=2843612 RepID=A0ABS6NYF5_9PSED|nr:MULTISPECIES: hypothetical protein [Pseudomonas]MBV4453252.1 hypothetical protein [Pseudomonas azadiae]NMF40771.1 hypothetical protein [Pseudomonas sp. SWRI 103]